MKDRVISTRAKADASRQQPAAVSLKALALTLFFWPWADGPAMTPMYQSLMPSVKLNPRTLARGRSLPAGME